MINSSRIRGVSLIEVAVTLSVLAMVVSLALPSYEKLRQKRDITSAGEELAAFLQSTRGVSVLTNQPLTVSLVQSGRTAWCVGARLGATACDCSISDIANADYCQIDGAPQIVAHDPSSLSQLVGHSVDTQFTFEPVRGLMINADLGNAHFFLLDSENEDYGLRIEMLPTGRVRVCSYDSDKTVPGYDPCPLISNLEAVSVSP